MSNGGSNRGPAGPARRATTPGRAAPSPTVVVLTALAVLTLVAGGCAGSSAARSTTRTSRPAPTQAAAQTTTTTTTPSATPTSVPAPVGQAPGWSATLTTLPPGGGFTSLACLSDTFCVATGGGAGDPSAGLTTGSGVAVSWDGAAWSNPSPYYVAPVSGPVTAPLFPAIACTAGPSCAIVDGTGHLSTGDGTNWSTPAPIPALSAGSTLDGSRTEAVSCPTPSVCAVVDNTGNTSVRRGGAWTRTQAFGLPPSGLGPTGQAARVGLACSSDSSCTAVVGTAALDWNGSGWMREPAPWTTAATGPTAVSCPSPTLCAAVTGSGVSFRTPSRGWSPTSVIDPGGILDAVTCPTTTRCVAADAGGKVVTWNGLSWSAPQATVPAPTEYPHLGTSLSCPDPSFCMILNGDGDYATSSGATTPPVP